MLGLPCLSRSLLVGRIRQQIERFAPNFRDTIAAFHEHSPSELENWNRNLVGGDIAGGAMNMVQFLFRPAASFNPYRLQKNIYLASSATPPGAGVHGVPGWLAVGEVLKDYKT